MTLHEARNGGNYSPYGLVKGIFESAYSPDSKVEIITVEDSETIKGKQADGNDILLIRPTLGKTESGPGRGEVLQIVIMKSLLVWGANAQITQERLPAVKHYAAVSEDAPIFLMYDDVRFTVVDPGEASDVCYILENSDFTSLENDH